MYNKKSTTYTDITLMQYADGELDVSTQLHLEKDLIGNKELQDRLSVFTETRADLISVATEVPKHIEDLIDEHFRKLSDEKILSTDAKKISKIKTFIGISIIILLVYLINLDNSGKHPTLVNPTNESTEVIDSLAEAAKAISIGAGAHQAFKITQQRKKMQNNSHQKLKKCKIKKIWHFPVPICS